MNFKIYIRIVNWTRTKIKDIQFCLPFKYSLFHFAAGSHNLEQKYFEEPPSNLYSPEPSQDLTFGLENPVYMALAQVVNIQIEILIEILIKIQIQILIRIQIQIQILEHDTVNFSSPSWKRKRTMNRSLTTRKYQ